MKPIKFISNKDQIIRTRVGHSIEFKKGEPTHVPPEAWAEVQARGVIPEEDLPEPDISNKNEPDDPMQRKKVLMDAFEAIVLEGNRDDFMATGRPTLPSVFNRVKFKIDAKERDSLWDEYKQSKDA